MMNRLTVHQITNYPGPRGFPWIFFESSFLRGDIRRLGRGCGSSWPQIMYLSSHRPPRSIFLDYCYFYRDTQREPLQRGELRERAIEPRSGEERESNLRFSLSLRCFAARSLFREEKIQEKPLGRGYLLTCIRGRFLACSCCSLFLPFSFFSPRQLFACLFLLRFPTIWEPGKKLVSKGLRFLMARNHVFV